MTYNVFSGTLNLTQPAQIHAGVVLWGYGKFGGSKSYEVSFSSSSQPDKNLYVSVWMLFAGFLAQMVQGGALEDCVRSANYAANYIIQQSGCQLPDKPNFSRDSVGFWFNNQSSIYVEPYSPLLHPQYLSSSSVLLGMIWCLWRWHLSYFNLYLLLLC